MTNSWYRSPDETPAQYAVRMRQEVGIIVSRVRAEMGDPGYDMDAVIEELEAIATGEAYFIFKDRLQAALTEATEQLGFDEAWAIIGPWMMAERAKRADPDKALNKLLDEIATEPAPRDEMPYANADLSVLRGMRPCRVVCTPDTCGGRPRIDGTRLEVAQLISYMRGMSIEEISKEWSHLPPGWFEAIIAWLDGHGEPR